MMNNLGIAIITKEEANRLDHERKLKTKMPENWDIRTGDIMDRLKEADIKLECD